MVNPSPAPFDTSASLQPILGGLDPVVRKSILASATRRHVAADEQVVVYGDAVDNLYVVESGLLIAEVPGPESGPVEIARFTAGTVFGEMAFLERGPASATVRALSDCDLWLVPHERLTELADQNPAIVRELARMVASRLVQTNLRFRPGTSAPFAAIVSDGSQRALTTVRRVAASAARHLDSSVAVVRVSGASEDASAGEKDVDAPELARIEWVQRDPESLTSAELLGLCEALRKKHAFVLVHMDSRYPALGSALETAARVVVLREADQGVPAVSEPASGLDTVLIGGTETTSSAAGLQRAGELHGCNVVGIIPDDPPAGQPHAHAPIDRLARHLIQRKVGLALGAGGAKGYAHLGVVQRLTDLGVPIDAVAGASIGAPISAAVAARRTVPYMRQQLDVSFNKALKRRLLPISSLLNNRALAAHLREISGGGRFEDLPTPAAIVAVDLAAREEVVFTRGLVAEAILASMAIPGIFPPIRSRGRTLVDGALLNPVPSGQARRLGADVVIAVRLSTPAAPPPTDQRRRLRSLFRTPPIFDTILGALDVMQKKITDESLADADVTIDPEFAGAVRLLDFGKGDEFIRAGSKAVDAVAPELATLLPWVTPAGGNP